jgi:hypothetical protein
MNNRDRWQRFWLQGLSLREIKWYDAKLIKSSALCYLSYTVRKENKVKKKLGVETYVKNRILIW